MKNKNVRVVPLKNYVILGIVIVFSFLLLYYFYLWANVYNETLLTKSILDDYMEVINYNELDDYLIENPNSVVYVSVLENSEVRKFEEKLKISLKNKKVNRSLLYLNITEELKNDEIKKYMKSKYTLNYVSMLDVPLVMVFDGGVLKSVYSVDDNNYNVDGMISFINSVKFSDEDEIDG